MQEDVQQGASGCIYDYDAPSFADGLGATLAARSESAILKDLLVLAFDELLTIRGRLVNGLSTASAVFLYRSVRMTGPISRWEMHFAGV